MDGLSGSFGAPHIAVEWRRTCGASFLAARDGQVCAAVVLYLVSRAWKVSRDIALPWRAGNSTSAGWPARSVSQSRSTLTAGLSSGVQRSFRPLSQRWDKGRYLDVSVIPMSHM